MSNTALNDIQSKNRIQEEALNAWRSNKGRGIIAMCTGAGKSKVAINACKLLSKRGSGVKVLILVPTTILRDKNWKDEFNKWGLSGFYNKCVRTECYASIGKFNLTQYNFIILDEAHNITERHFPLIKDAISTIPTMALTATPPEEFSEKAVILQKLELPVVYSLPLSKGVELGIVAPFDLTVVQVSMESKRKTIKAGRSPNKYWTTEEAQYKRLDKMVKAAMYDKDMPKERKDAMIRMRMHFVYNLPSKEIVAKYILDNVIAPTERTLVFAGSIAQAEAMTDNVYHSKSDANAFMDFVNQKINRLACIRSLDEGHNIPNLDSAIIIQTTSQHRQMVQRLGRIIRKRDNHTGKIFLIVAKNTVDENWAYSALSSAGIDSSMINVVDFDMVQKGIVTW